MLSFAFSGESRYLTPLHVSGNENPTITDSELRSDKVDPNHHKIQDLVLLGANKVIPSNQKIQDRIIAALKLLTFREQHVLVQFWSCEFGEHQYLTTIGQPFGLGEKHEGLCLYRKDSEGRRFFIVDKDHEEEAHSPAERVFRRGLPEWTSDLDNYTLKQFQQQECAVRCNLHGYLALPVFDLNTQSCVGVLELLTASKYMSYSYEVQLIHAALKTQNLISPQRFDFPASYVPNERRRKDLYKIYSILKKICDSHSLPLAQTWAVSQHASFFSHEKLIQNSCSSFDTRCVGKVCMFTAALPFHVKDLRMWPFREACREQHLDRSRRFVGKALLSCGSCFCGDVTKLSEEEYPLVHNARMNKLTSCFTIFLRSVEANDDYVLEFFLLPDIKDGGQILNLVKTLKQNIEIDSGFELGDSSCLQVVGPSMDLFVNMEPDVIQTSCDSVAENFMSSDSESLVTTGSTNLADNLNMEYTCVTSDAGENCNRQNKKRKIVPYATPSVDRMVTAKITSKDHMKTFQFPISLGFQNLENKVAQSFELEGKKFHLKYIDEDEDEILITRDEDLKLAFENIGSINIICLLDGTCDY